MQNIKINPPRIYTGEGFKGERVLAITAVLLTIVSSALLIQLSILQRKQIKEEMALLLEKKRKEEEEKEEKAKAAKAKSQEIKKT